MTDFTDGRDSARFVLSQVLDESAPYREGYGSAIKASGLDLNALALLQNVKGDRDDDPDGFNAGFASARETIRQVFAKSAAFKAGFASELRVVDVKAEFDAVVAAKIEQKLADHYEVKRIAVRLMAGRMLNDRGVGLTAKLREQIEVGRRVIEKMADRRDLEQRVAKKLFEREIAAGRALFVDSNGAVFKSGEGPTTAQRKMQRIAYFTKDAPVLETRDGPRVE